MRPSTVLQEDKKVKVTNVLQNLLLKRFFIIASGIYICLNQPDSFHKFLLASINGEMGLCRNACVTRVPTGINVIGLNHYGAGFRSDD